LISVGRLMASALFWHDSSAGLFLTLILIHCSFLLVKRNYVRSLNYTSTNNVSN
jgi:hypothetical protein